jgi:hypothetical protein
LKIEFKMITGGACALKEAASTILEHLTWKWISCYYKQQRLIINLSYSEIVWFRWGSKWVKRERELSRQAIDHGSDIRVPERGRGLDRAFARCRFGAGSGGFPLAGLQAEKITWQFVCLARQKELNYIYDISCNSFIWFN